MRLSFGRYIPKDSIIHRMDPRLKLFMLITLIATVFFRIGFTGFAIILATVLFLFLLSKLRISMLLRIWKFILFIFISLCLINFFLVSPTITDQWYWGGGEDHGGVSWFIVSEQSIYLALYITLRILCMITITTILTATTQPLDLTLALEDLLSPLKIFRIPVYIFSVIVSIALRMIPTLIEEASIIMKAQSSRGIDFKNGKFKEKIKASVSLIIPLLVSAFSKAEDLAYAMDSRGYNPKAKRTRSRQYKIKILDIGIFLFFIGIASTVIASSFNDFLPFSIEYLDKFLQI
ncbi:energy-coupling factor transporter transmembrane component T [Spiroplasma endosymbiont of Amphibalanus improvisus]|uniref:energy-coupling factor transporter transmembrane component T family protein n=1 Tax=Spiroplasma endosymbiont of Amphibalanus improvisus TaxID=3066327 RepID=UPI00313AC4FE